MAGLDWKGLPELERALQEKSRTDFMQVGRKSMLEIYKRGQQAGGTPVDTNELRMSMRTNAYSTYYNAEYAPHVEYGHRTRSGRFVQGQFFLKRNVDTQRSIYYGDLKSQLRK